MIFTGDFIANDTTTSACFDELGGEFLNQKKVINFESSLASCTGDKLTKGIALRSPDDCVAVLSEMNVVCLTMANNHVTDYEIDVVKQNEIFAKKDIHVIGFGVDASEAAKPYICHDKKLVVLTFGWDVIRCQYAKKHALGVNPYAYDYAESEVARYIAEYSDYSVVVTIHWNYEFEKYPQPADRQFALHLIDMGVEAIIGHHPHIISGCEFYKEKPIFYSLGNFYFPEGDYEGYQLKFHDEARLGLSVQLDEDGAEPIIYLHRLDPEDDKLRLVEHCRMMESSYLEKLSGFRGLSHQEYCRFFEEHKFHKRKLLPTYKSYTDTLGNKFRGVFVKLRQVPVDLRSKLKGGDSR